MQFSRLFSYKEFVPVSLFKDVCVEQGRNKVHFVATHQRERLDPREQRKGHRRTKNKKKKKEKKRKESLLFDRFPSTDCVIYIFVTVLSGLVDVTLYVLSEANASCTMYIRSR